MARGVELGLWLSSEEHGPSALVRMAQRAEESGLTYVQISDHFHPWVERQGQSPFVWTVIGGIAATTERLRMGTGVTCPIMRTHPVVIAHAAATSAAISDGRFFLGVGTGENLNEHVIGRGWPEITIRREMLVEAIEIFRLLFQGGTRTYRGRYYTVEDARLYTLPDEPPPVLMAASGPTSARIAGAVADGLVATSPDREVFDAFDEGGGAKKPRYTGLRVCWARTDAEARRLVQETWPNAGLPGQLDQDLRLPKDFEEASAIVRPETITKDVPLGPDPGPYVEAVRRSIEGGFDHIAFHQVGPDQDGFLRFWSSELRPALEREVAVEVGG